MRKTLEKTERFELISLSEIRSAFNALLESLKQGGVKHRGKPVRDSHLVAGMMAMLCDLPLKDRLIEAKAALKLLDKIQEGESEHLFESNQKSEVLAALKEIDAGLVDGPLERGTRAGGRVVKSSRVKRKREDSVS